MPSLIKIIILFVVFGTWGCNSTPLVENTPVARVQDKVLFTSDIVGVVPQGISSDDSLQIVNSFIDKWVRSQLLLKKAEEALSPDQKNIDKQIDAYRTSLMIYKFEEQYVSEKLDTIVPGEEIEKYYTENIESFKLDDNLVKAVYIKLRLDAPDLDKVRFWIRTQDPDAIRQLEVYAFQHAVAYDYFDDDWVRFKTIAREIPLVIDNPDQFLRFNKSIDTRDQRFQYLVYIREYQPSGTVSPLNFVMNDIREIILNKRKFKLLKDLETSVYNEGAYRNLFRIY